MSIGTALEELRRKKQCIEKAIRALEELQRLEDGEAGSADAGPAGPAGKANVIELSRGSRLR